MKGLFLAMSTTLFASQASAAHDAAAHLRGGADADADALNITASAALFGDKLTSEEIGAARDGLMTAANALYANRAKEHYTEGSERWYGITNHVKPPNAPLYSDCSSAATWVYWTIFGDGQDFLNGESWSAGYTGTMVSHGTEIKLSSAQKGDLVFYGGVSDDGDSNGAPTHVAIYIGDDMVISHGEDPVDKVSVHYRSDINQVRKYI
eukprot:CAMPEP_0195533690 /NCGR_PEP_ID=MMETSP0794_2-20130614/41006_1 /TAXON_ID=515487 /ORGANISM="Stephanopyxis turris, Strain CCMP 815" /LENGTH=207 /DNA_ID=CAMNT_0040666317 /DNA_START=9 /DNA_END=632 /DNA_ORIENTATION=+